MGEFDHLELCRDVTSSDIRKVAERRDGALALALMERFERIAVPGEGAGNVLMLLSAIAHYARWLDDRLSIEFVGRRDGTSLDLVFGTDAVRERMWRKFFFRVPLMDFEAAALKISRHPKCPFQAAYIRNDTVLTSIVLEMVIPLRQLTMPPPSLRKKRPASATAPDSAGPPSSAAISRQPSTDDVDENW